MRWAHNWANIAETKWINEWRKKTNSTMRFIFRPLEESHMLALDHTIRLKKSWEPHDCTEFTVAHHEFAKDQMGWPNAKKNPMISELLTTVLVYFFVEWSADRNRLLTGDTVLGRRFLLISSLSVCISFVRGLLAPPFRPILAVELSSWTWASAVSVSCFLFTNSSWSLGKFRPSDIRSNREFLLSVPWSDRLPAM